MLLALADFLYFACQFFAFCVADYTNLALTKLWDLYSRIVEILKSGDPGTAAPLVQEAAELESRLKEVTQGLKKIRRSKDGYTNF